jgi:hypothetical protein
MEHQKETLIGCQLYNNKAAEASVNSFLLNWWMVLVAVGAFALAGIKPAGLITGQKPNASRRLVVLP